MGGGRAGSKKRIIKPNYLKTHIALADGKKKRYVSDLEAV